ncbi:nucleoside triphosphate pyrophosphohydrolase [Shewanella amazonensis]|uniref:Nucleoside triphosphate pyrophosphohydrolase n=1 Tax=Shewanella amazonensis (strain ATCC BAA-1098 / SB2B) TaxID=326297 RepID=A1S4D5_SHEAM|nr:nucleoside triphosphate pyrophosphohydrolase [Shewanella amazonensis]ABL99241.1 MazG family protein [Shewanella amazonensis SB2B]
MSTEIIANEEPNADINPLLAIMAKLRDPKHGCPWDKAQRFETIVPFTLEEAYEVADTIERMDLDELPDELGDLLFQVVFYCQLGKEQGLFDFDEVVKRICAKLTSRHPHVFGDIEVSSSKEVKDNWEAIKASERKAKDKHSVLDDVPVGLPALSRAAKIQKRVARVGFDWGELPPVVAKVEEEIAEVLAEVQVDSPDQERVASEMGDLLFAVVNMARHLGVEPEQALRRANQKFERRFRGVEELATLGGRQLTDYSLAELDGFWDQVKEQEKSPR